MFINHIWNKGWWVLFVIFIFILTWIMTSATGEPTCGESIPNWNMIISIKTKLPLFGYLLSRIYISFRYNNKNKIKSVDYWTANKRQPSRISMKKKQKNIGKKNEIFFWKTSFFLWKKVNWLLVLFTSHCIIKLKTMKMYINNIWWQQKKITIIIVVHKFSYLT
jgi:hypothetical protein